MRWILVLCCFVSVSAFSQKKNFVIGVKGDTLNVIDASGKKQGRWVVHVDPLRGEPGYEEEGTYKDDIKAGLWRTYSLQGDLVSVENYRYGQKDGLCYYYNIYGLVRTESWHAVNPENPYDTVEVPDLHTDEVYLRVIKIDASTIKHGTWTYYNPQTGDPIKTEEYVLDKLVATNKASYGPFIAKDSTNVGDSSLTKVKPKEVLEYEKKNSKKKKIRVRDGDTGVQ